MHKVSFPLTPTMTSPEVGNLQDVLQLLIDRLVLLANDEDARKVISADLATERAKETYGEATAKLVKLFQNKRKLRGSKGVDQPTADALNAFLLEFGVLIPELPATKPFKVVGHVRRADGSPVDEAIVRAFDRDLRKEELLGEAALDSTGFYEISYASEQFRRAEKKTADLIVRVFSLKEQLLVASDIVFNASSMQVVDLVLASQKSLSEYDDHVAEISPLLEGLPFSKLNEDDVDFIAGDCDIPHLHVAFLALAHQYAEATLIVPEAFYGLFRQELPTTLPGVMVQSSATIRRALEASIDQNIIDARFREEIEKIFAALKRQVGEQILANAGPKDTVPQLLDAAGLSRAEQEQFLTAYVNHDGDAETFWDSLKSTSLVKQVDSLQSTFQMGMLTQHNVPLIRALQSTEVRTIRDIPRRERRELEQLIAGSEEILAGISNPDPTIEREQKAEQFVAGMLEVLQAAIPTAFVRAAYEKRTDDPLRLDVSRVLGMAPELELRDDRIDDFLKDRPGILKGLEDPAAVTAHLKSLQRTIRIAPDYEHAEVLLSARLDSARAITSMAPAAFEELFSSRVGGVSKARDYYGKAQQVQDALLDVASIVRQTVNDHLPGVIQPVSESVRTLPNFSTLFGSQSLCACKECCSVLSPAAYLVDILEFINPRIGPNPLSALRKRRPDIEHIQLSCENTNTLLPYVDLVNEILEFYVEKGVLTSDAAKNTSEMTENELSVNPQHVFDGAYAKLSAAVYPPSLPFDRSLAISRAYLDHMGVHWRDLLEAFRPESDERDTEIDLDYLNISAFERDILIAATSKPLTEFYGFSFSRDLSRQNSIRVSEFLERMRLSYEELNQLRAMKFLNPKGSIQLVSTEDPPTCDLSKIEIENLTIGFWRQSHRVIRLWRKLGWSIRELDLVLTVLKAADITVELLSKLSTIQRLSNQLKLPVEVLLAFWSDLDAEGPDSLFQRVFLNPAILNPPNPDLVQVSQGRKTPFAGNVPPILAALRITPDDFSVIGDHLGLDIEQAQMDLTILSEFYRHAVLAKALKLTIRDMVSLLILSGEGPLATASPQATMSFKSLAALVRESGFSIAQLNYIYRSQSDVVNPIALSTEAIASVLKALSEDLDKTPVPDDQTPVPDGQTLADEYAAIITKIISDALGFDSGVIRYLLTHLNSTTENSTTEPPQHLQHDFEVLLRQGDTPDFLPKSLIRLHKAAIWLSLFNIGLKELQHLVKNAVEFDDFDLNALPSKLADFTPGVFKHWRRMAELSAFRRSLPSSDTNLFDVFAAANLPPAGGPRETAIARLEAAAGWKPDEVAFLIGPSGLNLASEADFKNEKKLSLLQKSIGLSVRLEVSCKELSQWAKGKPSTLASNILNVAKAKYSGDQWLKVARPINDHLRELRRDMLVDYILGNDMAVKRANLTNRNQLFEYFLIDVQMNACMKTSRIKQAISSVQHFIQRCFLNLELPDVSPTSINAGQWDSIKSYRVWEASRRIFLYPEAWIEPDLRDDKTQFFQDLETELLQNEVTMDVAEDAIVHYLQKLDKIAHLEICGLYVQEPQDNSDEEIVHVFGRTKETPHEHYYCRRLNRSRWTSWDKLEMDIQSDHLIPVVHNRRLYLFWPEFQEKKDADQQLKFSFIQSDEHFRWLTVDVPAWKDKQKQWEKEHAVWEKLRDNDRRLIEATAQDVDFLIKAFKVFKTVTQDTWNSQNPGNRIDFDNGVEDVPPRKPQEPPFSTPPALTHWEIKLAWSEYKSGNWSPRQTSRDFIISPHVVTSIDRSKLSGIDSRLLEASNSTNLGQIIVYVYLPSQEEHLFQAITDENTGELRIKTSRRFEKDVQLTNNIYIDTIGKSIKGHEELGEFALQCGSKLRGDSFEPLKTQDYESFLNRPESTTNAFMYFRGLPGTNRLSIKSGGDSKVLLQTLPHGNDFSVLHEHQRPQFNLEAPFQTFFFQDDERAYFSYYYQDAVTEVIQNPRLARPPGMLQMDSPLVSIVRGRLNDRLQAIEIAKKPPGRDLPVKRGASRGVVSGGEVKRAIFSLDLSTAEKVNAWIPSGWLQGVFPAKEGLRFETFFHPHVCEFVKRLYRSGVTGLLTRNTQQLKASEKEAFEGLYSPSQLVNRPYPEENVAFDSGVYAHYNWELFFHIPMLIANMLTKNQRFSDALQWYHFVFNPTTGDAETKKERYWNVLPFFNNTNPENEQIQNLLEKLAGKKPGWQQIEAQIDAWRDDPFNPHLIARMRLTAYQKNVVMKYIDNLIEWADQLFSRDTIEAINEASVLYILAYNILGPRPAEVPEQSSHEFKTYKQLEGKLDDFSNALIEAENVMPHQVSKTAPSWTSRGRASGMGRRPRAGRQQVNAGSVLKSAVHTLYFCIPQNEDMLKYWDTVDDRLYKIRHCMNIEGGVRELPLFEPRIDPALLVRARAAGMDINSVLNDLSKPSPHYRFSVMLQKAIELCSEVKSLGAALLSALEKRDSETLSNLRAGQETSLLRAVGDTKRIQIEESEANLEVIRKNRLVVEEREAFYRNVPFMIPEEVAQSGFSAAGMVFGLVAQGLESSAGTAHLAPDFLVGSAGWAGSPLQFQRLASGDKIASSIHSAASNISLLATMNNSLASISGMMAGFQRRSQDWNLQKKLATKEITQIDKQSIAAELRKAVAEQELENHEKQIENSNSVQEFLRDKYTNDQLYSWMVSQISKVYFQSYKIAYDLAKAAERAYGVETGIQRPTFIQFGHWDNRKKGLLAGEQLVFDLKRMEASYFSQNKREYELTKHVSLLQVSPIELVRLRETGACSLDLKEELFELDTPGLCFRRIKSVSLSIPCVTGAYASVNCTLRLISSSVRDSNGELQDSVPGKDAIVTSSAQNDSGLFETNLRDERYLPFENAGAICKWSISLSADPSKGEPTSFDYRTISDVILHMRYTARDLKSKPPSDPVSPDNTDTASGNVRLFSVRHEFPTAWAKFKDATPDTNQRFRLAFDLQEEHYPFWAQSNLKNPLPSKVSMMARVTQLTTLNVFDKDGTSLGPLAKTTFGNLLTREKSLTLPSPVGNVEMFFESNEVSDLWIAVDWSSRPS